MQGTIDGFTYGWVTPVIAYVMACLGAALGLRCTTRSLLVADSWRPGWLALGSAAIGSGIWTMHFVAMMGFTVRESPINYDITMTFASLGVAIVMVGVGVFIVGYKGGTTLALLTGGTLTGLGVASMHYLGMAAMHLNGRLLYDTGTVVLSVLVAVFAATAALWAAAQVRGFGWTLGASLVMGVAVTGMHYTGMAALSVSVHDGAGSLSGASSAELLTPMLIGPLAFLLLAGVIVMFDPVLIMGRSEWEAGQAADRARAERAAAAQQSVFTPTTPAFRPAGTPAAPYGAGPYGGAPGAAPTRPAQPGSENW
ncbi:MHYT domain-containing protein [Streptomyces sp. NPDC049906]|uniref:MHYT domain-containing protein n=1 Tax=Streptomyces sp. NPDC049906 TaxID=3155656 RepID=UPI003419D98A